MKVDVIQLDDIKFNWFSRWSNWVDIAVVNQNYGCYLIQMKVSRSNSKKFKCVTMAPDSIVGRKFGVTAGDIGDLTQMKGANG